jgi:hypothetical protein
MQNLPFHHMAVFFRIVHYMKVELNQFPQDNKPSVSIPWLTLNLRFLSTSLENSITNLSAVQGNVAK